VDLGSIRSFYRENMRILIDEFSSYEPLIHVEGKRVVILGDIHGDLTTLGRVMENYPPDKWIYVTLGDYVDRGEDQLETLTLILMNKLKHGSIVLRGNHESPLTNFEYGFYMELLKKLGDEGERLYDDLVELFSHMPLAAVLNDKYFLVHGGLPIRDLSLEELLKLPKPDVNPDNEVSFQLLWNDPTEDEEEYAPNTARGFGIYYFGKGITRRFLERNDLSMVIRGHEYFRDGYSWSHGGLVLTVFTSRAGPYSFVKPKVVLVNGDELTLAPADQSGTA